MPLIPCASPQLRVGITGSVHLTHKLRVRVHLLNLKYCQRSPCDLFSFSCGIVTCGVSGTESLDGSHSWSSCLSRIGIFWFKQAPCNARNILLDKHSHLKVQLVAVLYFLQQMEFAQLSWNCKLTHFKNMFRSQFWLQGSFLVSQTEVDKIISTQGPFSSSSGNFNHITWSF